jgi:3-hydroxyisobutyrate dehydrogenase-like beta-hydroxyacid dehydrogenase
MYKIFRDAIEDTRVLTLDEKKKKFLEIFGAKREEKDEAIKECDNIISMVKNNPEKRNVYANVFFKKQNYCKN